MTTKLTRLGVATMAKELASQISVSYRTSWGNGTPCIPRVPVHPVASNCTFWRYKKFNGNKGDTGSSPMCVV